LIHPFKAGQKEEISLKAIVGTNNEQIFNCYQQHEIFVAFLIFHAKKLKASREGYGAFHQPSQSGHGGICKRRMWPRRANIGPRSPMIGG